MLLIENKTAYQKREIECNEETRVSHVKFNVSEWSIKKLLFHFRDNLVTGEETNFHLTCAVMDQLELIYGTKKYQNIVEKMMWVLLNK